MTEEGCLALVTFLASNVIMSLPHGGGGVHRGPPGFQDNVPHSGPRLPHPTPPTCIALFRDL